MALNSIAYFRGMNMQQIHKIVLFNISLVIASEVILVMQRYNFNRNCLTNSSQMERNPKYWYESKVYYLDCKVLNTMSSISNSLIGIFNNYEEQPKSGHLDW